jgi:hypothetical protein
MTRHVVSIMFDGPAGFFEGPEYPRAPGVYRYMPFRSFPHYSLGQAVRSGESARCYYDLDGERVFFSVVAFPEVHVMEVTDFAIDRL